MGINFAKGLEYCHCKGDKEEEKKEDEKQKFKEPISNTQVRIKKIEEREKQLENQKKEFQIQVEISNKKLEKEKSDFENYKNEEINQLQKQKEDFEKYKKEQLKKNDNSPILIGLNNIGATCYMNSTLQALSNTNDLTEYFLNQYKYDKNDLTKIMANEFYKLLLSLWDKDKKEGSFSPNDFKETLSEQNDLFKGINANDSKDLINYLLEEFHKELNNPDTTPKNQNIIENQLNEMYTFNLFSQDFQRNYKSIISDLFYGVLETKNQCKGCNYIKFNFQVYSFLEFPLEQVNNFCFQNGRRMALVNNDGTNPDVNLYECFDYYQKIEVMSGDNQMYCNICKIKMLYIVQFYILRQNI